MGKSYTESLSLRIISNGMFKYFLLWFPMLIIAVANGTAREWYIKFTGELLGRQISTITLILFFSFYIFWVVNRYPLKSDNDAILVGIIWLILTLAFEFGFGLFRGNSWNLLLNEYNILEGKLWIFVPLWVAIAPFLLRKI